jgi:methyl-accepting chemotaxis protein
MKNLKIRNIITLVIGLLIAFVVIVGALGYYSTNRAVDLLENKSLHSANQQLGISRLQLRMEQNRSHILQALQHNPENKYAGLHRHPLSFHSDFIAKNNIEIDKELDTMKASFRRPETRERFAQWMTASDTLAVNMISQAMATIERGDWDAANQMLAKQINPTYNQSLTAYNAMQSFMSERNLRQSADLHAELKTAKAIMISAILAAILLSCAAAWYLLRAIGAPLAQAIEVAGRVANGDLSVNISTASRNEFGQLLNALGSMTTSLADIVKEVRSGSEVIATASTQIAVGNLDLSSRTEQQASSIEETSASVEELTSTVRQNADNARQANALTVSATEVAKRGGVVVSEVVDTMGEINASARKIVDIISVIDGIAFQTNILALNAAVEAARAGEQGRGFAVVATEVRNLAQRSAVAAKEIKELITDSVNKVEAGARLADQAGATMVDIVQGVQRVAVIMGEITVASAEQSAGIEQIHRAISIMDQSTQQNAALVEEAASAADSMRESAAGLSKRVSIFKITEHPRAPRSAEIFKQTRSTSVQPSVMQNIVFE